MYLLENNGIGVRLNGIGTVKKAKRIVLLAWGHNKASVVKETIEGEITSEVPATYLQEHPNTTFILNEEASQELTRVKTPWLVGPCIWTEELASKAIVWLSQLTKKSILRLTDKDYNDHGMSSLLVQEGTAYDINIQMFNKFQHTITGWPGGKPNAVIPAHPERSAPHPKKVLIFSPHPDDDIISMGGTFMRLQEQGHDVHVAYQTSGNIAVTDEFVTRFLDFAVGFEDLFGIDNKKSQEILINARKFLAEKQSTHLDTAEIRAIKGLIRRCEAKATCRYVGLKDTNYHFLDLPFYETGTIDKKPMSELDIRITMDLLNELKPHQVYCAGDLADPHGTHKVCLEIIFESLRRLKASGETWVKDCWVWLYKGAWQEWAVSEIEMAVPMSPDQVLKKRFGIFIHQSQKDSVPFQGTDSREFWQRAEIRNANTADLYASLGLTKYAAIEAFVRWHY